MQPPSREGSPGPLPHHSQQRFVLLPETPSTPAESPSPAVPETPESISIQRGTHGWSTQLSISEPNYIPTTPPFIPGGGGITAADIPSLSADARQRFAAHGTAGLRAEDFIGTGVVAVRNAKNGIECLPPKFYRLDTAADFRSTPHEWVIDCGAARHCVASRYALTSVQNEHPLIIVETANGTKSPVTCIGTVDRLVTTMAGPRRLHLSDVLVVDGLTSSLFSCKHAYDVDGICTYINGVCQIQLSDGSSIPIRQQCEKYTVDLSPCQGVDLEKDLEINLPSTIHAMRQITSLDLAHAQNAQAVQEALRPVPVTTVTAFMLTATEYDARKYTLCAPHNGEKGLAFKTFRDNFLTVISGVQIKDPAEIYDLGETIAGTCEGGPNTPPGQAVPIPMPAGGGLIAATRRRNRRLKLAYIYIYQHVPNEPIRRMFIAEALNNGYLAWQVLVRECDEPITDLELEDLKKNVRELTILDTVGYSDFSISKFRRRMIDENSKIPAVADQIDENELSLILLRCIAQCSNVLHVPCFTELKALPAQRTLVYPANHPNAGQRSLSAIVSHFEPLWKSALQLGSISLRAPTSSKQAGTSRVDSMLADANVYAVQARNRYAQETAEKDIQRKSETTKICWNCKGIGHFKAECPSPQINHSYADVISLLAAHLEKLPSRPVERPENHTPPTTEQAQTVRVVQDFHDGETDQPDNNDSDVD